MTINFECDTCGKQMQAPDDKAGKSGKCPECGERITVPSGDDDFLNEDFSLYDQPSSAGGSLNKPCPMCGEMIAQSSSTCPFCGERLDRPDPKKKRKRSRIQGSQESSTALTLFITGLLGCFSPILSIYGIIFLLRNQHDFDRKTLGIVGTVLHCFWTAFLIVRIASLQ